MPSMLTLTEAFREAFIHDRHVIMGREMQPFCIDHIMLLEALDSPLIMGGTVKIEDVQLAVKVCSTGSNAEFFEASLRPSFYWRLWGRVFSRVPVKGLIERWDAYLADYAPKIEQFRYEDQEACKCPGYVLTAAKLVERGHAPATVRRMGIGELTAWVLAIMENNPTPHNPNPLRSIKDDWDVETAREKAALELEAQSAG